MENFGKLCFGVMFMCSLFLMDGWLFQTYWTWFAVLPFDARMINYSQAVGLLMLIRFLGMSRTGPEEKDGFVEIMQLFLRGVVRAALYFFFAYLVHLFI